MLTLITPSYSQQQLGSYLTLEGDGLEFLDDPLFVEDANGELITRTVALPISTYVTRTSGSVMAINARATQPWFTGETATPFTIIVRHQDGTPRADIVTATFTLTNVATGTKLIDAQPCQSVVQGVLSYRPSSGQMATACLFRAQFIATLDTGYILPSFIIEGEIVARL